MDDGVLNQPATTRRALREAEAARRSQLPPVAPSHPREPEVSGVGGSRLPPSRRSAREAEAALLRTRFIPAGEPKQAQAPPAVSARRRTSVATAMTLSALLLVSVSLPALAVGPSLDTIPGAAAAAPGEPQAIVVAADVNAAVVIRDGYESSKAPTTASYSQTASTYVNYRGDVQWPFLAGVPISTDFGPRVPPCGGCSSFHKGIDMNPGAGSPIQAIAKGVVTEVSATDNGGLGVYAVIEHMIDGEIVASVYAHMQEGTLALSVGESVSVGQLVGNVGNTGQSTGPHLHFEILLGGVTPTDPFAWLTERVLP